MMWVLSCTFLVTTCPADHPEREIRDKHQFSPRKVCCNGGEESCVGDNKTYIREARSAGDGGGVGVCVCVCVEGGGVGGGGWGAETTDALTA